MELTYILDEDPNFTYYKNVYMILANHHAHTNFSDGIGDPADFLQSAIDKRLTAYGFSDHAPIPGFDLSAMKMEDLPGYLDSIDNLQAEAGDRIQIHTALEVDYIPGVIDINSPHIVDAELDYTIGAVHYVEFFEDGSPWGFEASEEQFQRGISELFRGDIRSAIERYYQLISEMVLQTTPSVVAHLDRIKRYNTGGRFFDERSEWYRRAVNDALDVIAESGSIMEVNTKGYYSGQTKETYPGDAILREAFKRGIPVHLASDAHHEDHIISGFRWGMRLLREVGYRQTSVFLDKTWQSVPLQRPRLYVS